MKKAYQVIHKFLLCVGFLLVFSISGYGQNYVTKKTATGKAKKVYYRANQYKKNRLVAKAIQDYKTVIKIAPDFIDAQYELAAIYFNQKNYTQARAGLSKVIEIDPTYKPQTYYYLGLAYWEENNFEQAIPQFDSFLKSNSKSVKLRAKATKYLQNSQFAAKALKNPVPFNPTPLGQSVNTSFPEYLPSVTAEGNTLVFTRRIRGDEDVFISKKVDGQWAAPEPILDINTPENEGSQYISADGSLIVFVRCSDRTGYGGCDLYFSEKKGDIWSKPENMGQPINTRGWESQPSLSADGNILYYASNRKGTLGGRDIWRSKRDEQGAWSNPVNLGPTINTTSDDESPFFHPDGKSLYFMSSGHQGMGGYDLFLSRRDGKKWEVPQNLGYPINTKGNEGALFITLDGTTAYFTKDNLPEKDAEKRTSRRQPDLFTFEMPQSLRPTPVTYIKATVKDALTTQKLANAKIEVVNLLTNEILSTSKTDAKGDFLACLPMGGNYALNVNKESYLFHSENFELLEGSSLQAPYLLKIKLQPIIVETTAEKPVKSEPIILKNVFFESGSNELKATSLTELNNLKMLLVQNEQLKIQINGHTDNVGSDTDNLKLSESRAKAVADYLIKQGISATRLSYKGFGESKPIDSNDTEAGRKHNRRTEFVTK
ncbi:MAG: OmpA family protein [Saprospiraceae bacterium]